MTEEDDLPANFLTEKMQHSSGELVPPDGLCWLSVLFCLMLACFYVGSLYVWRSHLPRDHPAVIKRRFTSVLIVSGLSPLFVWAWRESAGVVNGPSLLVLMGIRFEGLIPAIILPLLLTMVRNSQLPALSSLPAHFHHVIELLRFRQGTLLGIFLSAVFQFSYTAVFGAYTAFIFIRTGHLIGPVLCHSFCNYMGFPAISTALEHPYRLTVLSSYLLGVLLFFLLLFPFTDPSYYSLPVCTLTSFPSSSCLS
ncbi:CAAX prenyl protease 2 [Pundamilia nyererei]|uniref:CAAX prenyl protease 2 n=1 Tax=Pundamilia nyererei TaxID=303518 RepID=A0A9Y3VUJ9_9CICH|nr:PREDICTED: CAAX prenyl protease 2-like [Pundamilia nyererei]